MNAQKPKSLQDILKQQRDAELRETFVGRGEEIRRFRENLALPAEDRRFVSNIQGQGGVGKTFLLRHFVQLAEEQRFLCAGCTDEQRSVVDVLAKISESLNGKGVVLKSFDERYRRYRQKREELEADPELPAGSFELLGQAARVGLMAGAHALGASALAPLLNTETLGSRMGDVFSFFSKKLKPDEVQLLKEPIAILTPLWLGELRDACEDRSILLLFDVYERCAEFLDKWLRNLLEGRYGNTPLNLLFVVAGQVELPRAAWRNFETTLSRMVLEPFTEEESRNFLKRKGVKDTRIVADTFRSTQGLPVMLDLFVDARSGEHGAVNSRDTAIEHFLNGVELRYRQVALNAALPRWLNRDVLAELTDAESADEVFDWLKRRPFVLRRMKSREYHPVVRHLMLAHKHHESPEGWSKLHRKLGDYYTRLQEGLGQEAVRQFQDERWREYALEVLYHRMCEAPHRHQPIALKGFLKALSFQVSFARQWAETLGDAEEDSRCQDDLRWGVRLAGALKLVMETRFAEAIPTFTALLSQGRLESEYVAIALNWRGYLHSAAHQLDEAVADNSAAIELAPEESVYVMERGRALLLLQRYADAENDFTRAIELGPEVPGPYATRSVALAMLNRHEEAKRDIDRLISLTPHSSMGLGLKLVLSLQRGDKDQVLADLLRIASVAPQYVEELRDVVQSISLQRALDELQFILPKMGVPTTFLGPEQQVVSTLAELTKGNTAPMITAVQASAAAFQSLLHKQNANIEYALAAIERAVLLDPREPLYLLDRAELRARLGQREAAREDVDRAVAMAPASSEVFKRRGAFHMSAGRNQEALADFNQSIQMKPDELTFIYRCIVHRTLGFPAEALADVDSAIALHPDNLLTLLYRVPLQLALQDLDGVAASYSQLALNAAKFVKQLKTYAGMHGWAQRGTSLQNLISAMGYPGGRASDLLERLTAIVDAEDDEGARVVSAMVAETEARIHIRKAALPDALAAINRAVDLEPDRAIHRCIRADLYRQLERAEDAIAELDGLRESSEARIHVARCGLYLRLRRPDRGLVAADRALVCHPGLAEAHGFRGAALGMQRRYEEALEESTRAVQLDPDLFLAYRTRIRLFWGLGRYAEALSDLDGLVARGSWLVNDWPNERGELLARLGQYDEAQSLYRQVLKEKPDSWRAAYNLVITRAWMEGTSAVAGELADVLGQLQSARPIGDPFVLIRLAGIEALTESPDRAFALLNEALTSDPHLIHWAKGDLAWSRLCDDPRFQALLDESQLPSREAVSIKGVV